MSRAYLTKKKAQEKMEEWKLQREACELLACIVGEFNSDPKSVQCFDLRIVERSRIVTNRLQILQKERGF